MARLRFNIPAIFCLDSNSSLWVCAVQKPLLSSFLSFSVIKFTVISLLHHSHYRNLVGYCPQTIEPCTIGLHGFTDNSNAVILHARCTHTFRQHELARQTIFHRKQSQKLFFDSLRRRVHLSNSRFTIIRHWLPHLGLLGRLITTP